MAVVNEGCVIVGIRRNKDRPSDGDHSSREVAGLLFMVGGRGLGAPFMLFRANIGINADVVVCELAHLSVVDTDNLGLLRGTETEARDEVHDPEDDGGDDKGVAQASARIGELVGELDPVLVDPATGYDSEAIEGSDIGLSEDAS